MRLFIIRHADPDYPNNTITASGHLEAAALARRMQKQGLDRIFNSPLGRAMDTARYTADLLGITPATLPWTAELGWPRVETKELGEVTPWDVHGHVIRRLQPQPAVDNWHAVPPFDRPEYRKGFDALIQESDAFIESLGYKREGSAYRIIKSTRQKIAVFCHGGFGLTWLAHLLAIPLPLMWSGFFLPPSSVTTVLFDERGEGLATPRCLSLGDISHLYEAGLPMQPSGIKANVE